MKTKKLGRPKELTLERLPERFRDMKGFLENYWGRVGLGLRRAQQPEDVRTVLKLVPNIEELKPFRGYAICLIAESASEATDEQVRATRRKHKEVSHTEDGLRSEYNITNERAQRARDALNSAILEFQDALSSFEFFFILSLLARELKVVTVTNLANDLYTALRQSQKERESLKNILSAQEAWYARNQVVEFAKNTRHNKSLLNFARAGLPEWGWYHSRRICEGIKEVPPQATPYQIFLLLQTIVRGMRPLKLTNVEKRLREEFSRSDVDPSLRGYVGLHWHYLQDAILHCRGIKKSELPYRIMNRFLYHLERSKTITEIELARQNQLM